MTEGEPPDETGESEPGPRSQDGDSASDGDGSAATDAPVDDESEVAADDDGTSDDGEADPAAEVEAAVEEALGPDVLADSDETDDEATDEGGSPRTGEEDVAGERESEAEIAKADPSGGESTATEQVSEDSSQAEAPSNGETPADDGVAGEPVDDGTGRDPVEDVPADVRKYDRFKKIDGGTYDRANEFLRDRTYITAREWAMARLCADFRTETGVEMTKIGENLPELVPFMTDTYTPQAVNQARSAFEEKVRKAGATFLYGAMCDFFTAEELDDVMYEATEVAKFLLEVEGVELSVDEELAAEDHISEVMRDVREHSAALRHDEVTCPECGHEIGADD